MNTPTHIVLAVASVAVAARCWPEPFSTRRGGKTLGPEGQEPGEGHSKEPGEESADHLATSDEPASSTPVPTLKVAVPKAAVPKDAVRDRSAPPRYLWAATAGAILPDAPLFLFYAIEKGILGSTEREIWSTRYFLPAWQDFFDLFNSIPIFAIVLIVAWRRGRTKWVIFSASLLLHLLCDLPVHHDDGHRHFWPLLDWRYASPVSYWDPNHHGVFASVAEYVLFLIASIVTLILCRGRKTRAMIIGMGLIHSVMIGGMWLYFFQLR